MHIDALSAERTASEKGAVDPGRSALMKRVRQKNTKPELVVRQLLHRLGFRFRLHRRDLPGSPDIVLPGKRAVIFVHGCFWHRHPGCAKASTPKNRSEFWAEKFRRNVERDNRKAEQLASLGWRVLTVWECETRSMGTLSTKLNDVLLDKPRSAAQ